jgi:choline dehydrogenase-like flavoprotein
VGIYEFNIRGGLRDSVAEAYFRRSIPNNLEIVTGATVQKAIFQKHGEVPTATGVEYVIDKNKLLRHAMLRQGSNVETEVIFSAGAILTPQLLANSGIEEGGTTKHSPEVGKNVMDHPAIAVSFEMTHDSTEEVLSYFFGDSALDTFEDLVRSRMKLWVPYIDSPLSTPGFSTGGFLKSPFSTQNGPDIQLTVFPHLEEPHYSLTNKNMSRQWSYMMITVALIQPETRSELILAKSNGKESTISSRQSDTAAASNFQIPILKPGSLSENDTSKLVWGIEEVRRIMSSAPVTKRIVKEASPGKLVLGDSLKEYVRNNIMQNSHWSGTCRMGTDDKSVVDEYLKVRGVRNLRVIDASIMPQIPNGNTHSTTCAIALRAVDLIR